MKILLFRLEGVLQSWGGFARWDQRYTELFPTKSGLVGLMGCALGIESGSSELEELSRNIDVAVRADRAGKVEQDFHTVSSPNMLTAEGKKRALSGAILAPRTYLNDASFLVAVSSEDGALLDAVDAALKAPHWPVYLGRRCCTPSLPVIGRIDTNYDNLLDAVKREPLIERHDRKVFAQIGGNETSRMDELVCAKSRKYARRGVQTLLVYGEE